MHGLGAIVIQSDFSRGNVSSPQSLETMHLQTLFRNTNVLPREALWEGDLLIDFCHQRGSVEGLDGGGRGFGGCGEGSVGKPFDVQV